MNSNVAILLLIGAGIGIALAIMGIVVLKLNQGF
jgi:hypothetical protein